MVSHRSTPASTAVETMRRDAAQHGAGAETGARRQIDVLYISYDGLLEPLGESQVVSYLERLASRYRITVLSFEKREDAADTERLRAMEARLTASGVRWLRLRYHKHPAVVSTGWDVARGVWRGWRCAMDGPFQLVHARGYVAALVALTLKRLTGAAFLFDMRGFWADEKVDAGHWRAGSWLHRVTKRCERAFCERADAIVLLTHEGVRAVSGLGYRIPAKTPIRVITTCADLSRFVPGPRDAALASWLGLEGHRVIGVSGTVSNWYLRREMLRAVGYLAGHLPSAKILVVTQEDHAALRIAASAEGIPDDRLVIVRSPFAEMPAYLRLMDLGLFFIKPCFSKRGSSATKLGELLATGVPVVINDGIGDSGRIVRDTGTGIVLPSAELADLQAALPALQALLDDPQTPARCRRTAETQFNLEEGVAAYAALYASLLRSPDEAPMATAGACR